MWVLSVLNLVQEMLFIYQMMLGRGNVEVFMYRVVFLTGSALKVLSVGDGKIPTIK